MTLSVRRDNFARMEHHDDVLIRMVQAIEAKQTTWTAVAVACGYGEGAVRAWVQRAKPPRNRLIRAALERHLAQAKAAE